MNGLTGVLITVVNASKGVVLYSYFPSLTYCRMANLHYPGLSYQCSLAEETLASHFSI